MRGARLSLAVLSLPVFLPVSPSSFADDSLEPNDWCEAAMPLGPGAFPGLAVTIADPDFYAYDVPDGATLTIDIDGDDASGTDLDLFLFDGCPGATLDKSVSGGVDESVSWTNETGASVTVVVQVKIWDEAQVSCCTYDMVAGLSGVSLGQRYCTPAVVNSSGEPASITGFGSDFVTDNDVTLVATSLPTGKFGYFLNSKTQGNSQPPGSQGTLCLAGKIGRYNLSSARRNLVTAVPIGPIAPFFVVADVVAAAAFYTERLGFELRALLPAEDPFFALVGRGAVQILLKHVTPDVGPLPNPVRHPWAAWDAYVHCAEPEALARELAARGTTLREPVHDRGDGLRGLEVEDRDGYVLFFGCPVDRRS